MENTTVQRRLAAILAADIVGYSRLMHADEVGTLAVLKAHLRQLIDPTIAAHSGPRCASQQNRAPDFRSGSKADVTLLSYDVRYSPKSGQRTAVTECPLRARSRHRIGAR
jgi:hypothetical protein